MGLEGLKIARITDEASLHDAFALRTKVFVLEQGVSREDEFDGSDPESYHLGGWVRKELVSCARVRMVGADVKLERLAVERTYRGIGIGRRMLESMIDMARSMGAERIYLHSQVSVEGFYGKSGFVRCGDEFEEAGILHVMMVLGGD